MAALLFCLNLIFVWFYLLKKKGKKNCFSFSNAETEAKSVGFFFCNENTSEERTKR